MSSGVLIMTYTRPLLLDTYEVILLLPSSVGWQQKFQPQAWKQPRTSSSEFTALTARPGSFPIVIVKS